MKEIRTTEGLTEHLLNMNINNSVCQIYIPGKGKFTIVLQQEDPRSQMISDKMEAPNEKGVMSSSELSKNPFL